MLRLRKKQNNKPEDKSSASPVNIIQEVPDIDVQVVEQDTPKEFVDDGMARDLAVLVGNAITVWAKKYHLESLPKDIVLDQALAIIATVRDSL